jgi:Family of unknown function (DUF5681)
MSAENRPDFNTRFKKGQSGNPSGRPKGRKNDAVLIRDVLFKTVRVKDANGVRSVPKIVAAIEVCLGKALKGDIRALEKIIKLAEKLESIQWEPPVPEITCITRRFIHSREPMSSATVHEAK